MRRRPSNETGASSDNVPPAGRGIILAEWTGRWHGWMGPVDTAHPGNPTIPPTPLPSPPETATAPLHTRSTAAPASTSGWSGVTMIYGARVDFGGRAALYSLATQVAPIRSRSTNGKSTLQNEKQGLHPHHESDLLFVPYALQELLARVTVRGRSGSSRRSSACPHGEGRGPPRPAPGRHARVPFLVEAGSGLRDNCTPSSGEPCAAPVGSGIPAGVAAPLLRPSYGTRQAMSG